MLIFTRKIQEKFIIGDDVTVTILGVNGSQIRLGIDAPKDLSVHREEVYQRIQQEKQQTVNALSIDEEFIQQLEAELKNQPLDAITH